MYYLPHEYDVDIFWCERRDMQDWLIVYGRSLFDESLADYLLWQQNDIFVKAFINTQYSYQTAVRFLLYKKPKRIDLPLKKTIKMSQDKQSNIRKIDLKMFDECAEVCYDCWVKYGRREPHIHTIREWKCGMCWKVGQVCPPRDYWYAKILFKTQ